MSLSMLKYFRSSEFFKNIFVLASGSTIAQLITLIFEPVLSRIYTPSEFGVFEIYASIVVILGSVASARYEMAIILPRTENKAFNVLVLSFLIAFVFSFVSLAILAVLKFTFLSENKNTVIYNYWYYIPIGVFLIAAGRSFFYWWLRKKSTKLLSLSRISESSGKSLGSLIFGLLKFSSLGLIWGQLIGQFLSAFLLIIKFIRIDHKKFRYYSGKAMFKQAGIYNEFPKYNSLLILVETFQFSGLILIISFFYDNTIVGEFSKALRILIIPLSIIGASVAQVFYQKISQQFMAGEKISHSLNKLVFALFKWSLPGLIIFVFISPELFNFVLGNQWYTSGEYARIIAIWIFVRFVFNPATVIPMVVKQQKNYFIINTAGNLLIIGIIIVCGYYGMKIFNTIITFSVAYTLFNGFLFLWVRKILLKLSI